MDLLPLWYQYTMVIVLGLIIGSFLNVVLYRFHTGRSINGSSHCLSCGENLRWFELIPLVSYLTLRGKCRSCGCYIPLRYFLIELVTALLFLTVFMNYGITLMGGVVATLFVLLLLVTVYDLYHMVIPNELVLLLCIAAAGYMYLELTPRFSWEVLAVHAMAALGVFLFYGGLWFVSRGRWIGFGDAKLAVPLGFILGPMNAFSFVVFSFWVGALLSVGLLLLPYIRSFFALLTKKIKRLFCTCPQGSVVNYRRYFTMKSEVPFAPFMVIAFLLVFLCKYDVLTMMVGAI